MSTIFLCAFVLMLVLANRAWSPTATSPSTEDFSGLTLDLGLELDSAAIRHVVTGPGFVETFDTADVTRWSAIAGTWTVSGGALNVAGTGGAAWNRCGIIVASALQFPVGAKVTITVTGITLASYNLTIGAHELQALWPFHTFWQAATWIRRGAPSGVQNPYVAYAAASDLELTYERTSTNVLAYKIVATRPGNPAFTLVDETIDYSQLPAMAIPTTVQLEIMPTYDATGLCTGVTVLPYRTAALTAEQPVGAAFEPTGGAKLATLTSITPTLDATGAAGAVTLYSQHYNTPLGAWSSLADVAGEWTSHGAVTSGVAIDLSATTCRAGEKYRWKAEFSSTDGTLPPPKLTGLSLAWTSDTAAPAAPTIGYLISACDTGATAPGYRIGAAIPTGARHLIMEVNVNAGGFLPISQRARRESGQGYLEFVGNLAATEQAGGRNEVHYSDTKSLVVGDSVVVRVAAVDAVGNQSAWTTSSALTLASTSYVTLNTDAVTVSVAPETAIVIEVQP